MFSDLLSVKGTQPLRCRGAPSSDHNTSNFPIVRQSLEKEKTIEHGILVLTDFFASCRLVSSGIRYSYT
jgi:hypothetical protein